MRVLITGGGLLGAYSAREMLQRDWQIVVFDSADCRSYVSRVVGKRVDCIQGDVTCFEDLMAACQGVKPDVLLHTAGKLGRSFKTDVYDGLRVNCMGTLNATETAMRSKIRRLILCSSIAVYELECDSRSITEEQPISLSQPYDSSKYIAEQVVKAYPDLESVILRLSGMVGPLSGPGGGWMATTIHQLIEAAENSMPVLLREQELGTNEYLYVKDAAYAVAQACVAQVNSGATFNIGSGKLTTIAGLASAFRRHYANVPIEFVNKTSELSDFLCRTAPLCTESASRFLGFRSRFASPDDFLADYASEFRRISD